MNHLERFRACALGQEPDYVPIFGVPGAPGASRWGLASIYNNLVRTGMPDHVGGPYFNVSGKPDPGVSAWYRYWGVTGPVDLDFQSTTCRGFESTTRIEGGYQIVETESGEVTRMLIDNDNNYSMPEFISYPVRDRESWEFYKERMTPVAVLDSDELEAACRRYDSRMMPLRVNAGSTFGYVRDYLGAEKACLALYDSPDMVHDMIGWELENLRRFVFPLVERLRPEMVLIWEDICYNNGMLLSPAQFDEFCGEYYREVAEVAEGCGVPVVAVDTDGDAMEFTRLAASYGINGVLPYENKGGNDLMALREELPDFVFFGWLEKEICNEGNENLIEDEVMRKVPGLLRSGRYFPNLDHSLQPPATFPNLCKFMTILHEVCNNPEGTFPHTSS